MNIIIIEDEARAANRLERMILSINPDIHILAMPESIQTALEAISTHQDIDLIFSDIELGDGTCFEIFEKLETQTPIIFTTAYNQYAIKAFKVNGVDYLLKPIQEDELQKAIQKYQQTYRKKNTPLPLDAIAKAIHKMSAQEHKTRFVVKVGEKLKSVPVEDIAAFYTMAKGSFLMTKSGRNYALEPSLEKIMRQLDVRQFFKINRKQIVSLEAIEEILVHSNSRLLLKINGMEAHKLVVAREKVKEFKRWLDGE